MPEVIFKKPAYLLGHRLLEAGLASVGETYHEHEMDEAAIVKAVELLGIEEPVEIQPMFDHPAVVGFLGMADFPEGKKPWTVWVATRLPAVWPEHDSFTWTLWHELGHVLDMGAQIRAGATVVDLRDEAQAVNKRFDDMRRIRSVPDDEIMAQYQKEPAEAFAEAIAKKYVNAYPLERIGAPSRVQ